MGYRGREIETKLLVRGSSILDVNKVLADVLADLHPVERIGSSIDTYWTIHDGRVEGDFLRVRERDGIRQITVKGKDRDSNLNRIEVDIDSTSPTHVIHRLVRCLLGRQAGVVTKKYTVWELESEYDTVCSYVVDGLDPIVVEVEARTEAAMLKVESLVMEALIEAGADVQRAPGSLYEMCILGEGLQK